MRIALTVEDFRPWRGGGEGYVVALANALLERGHEVHVFASEIENVPEGITPHTVRARKFPSRRTSFALGCARMLDESNVAFDLVHGFGKSIRMDVFRPGGGVHRAWQRLDPLTVESPLGRTWRRFRRKFSLDQWLVLWLESKQLTRDPDGHQIIVNSQMVRRHVLEHYRVPEDRLHVIYNGVDTDRFTPENRERFRASMRDQFALREDDIVLVFVANNFRLKGLMPLIRAVGALRKAGAPVKLIVVGRDRQKRYLQAAKDLACNDAIVFAGAVRETEKVYAAADVFVHPTFYDPCANVTLEAMASGLPVVTSIYNGAGELVSEDAGAVVDPGDVDALAAAMGRFLNGEERALAAAAARAVAEEHGISWHIGEVLKVYDRALALRKR